MKKIKLGILGIGNIGTVHVNNILDGKCPNVELYAICDLLDEKMEWVKEKLPSVKCFNDAEAMMDSGVDSVLVAVPHYDHPKYAIMAMEKGLHTLVEKPAGVYTKQVLEMNAVADKSNVVFGLMMNQRTNCIYRKMREIVKSGEMGQIKRTSWIITNWYRPQAYYNSGGWRATWKGEGGGVLLNQCPHNLDLWQWICGMPVKVDAKLHYGKWHKIEVEDDVTAYVEYENGATGTFITTTGDAPGTNRLEIVCDGGTIITDGNSITLIKLDMPESQFSATNTTPFAGPRTQRVEVETDGQNPQHIGVLNAFAAAILRNEPLVADGREGIFGLTLSTAMHMSAWTGEAVTLPLDEEKYRDLLFEHVKTSRRKEGIEAVFSSTEGTYNS